MHLTIPSLYSYKSSLKIGRWNNITQVSKFRKHLLKMYVLTLFKILKYFLIRIFKAYLLFIKIENQNMREKLDMSFFPSLCHTFIWNFHIFPLRQLNSAEIKPPEVYLGRSLSYFVNNFLCALGLQAWIEIDPLASKKYFKPEMTLLSLALCHFWAPLYTQRKILKFMVVYFCHLASVKS